MNDAINLITKYDSIKLKNVQKTYFLQSNTFHDIDNDIQNLIFITSPNFEQIDLIANIVQCLRKNQMDFMYYLYFFPRKSAICDYELMNTKIYEYFTYIGEIKCDFFPIDNDLISMELDNAFK